MPWVNRIVSAANAGYQSAVVRRIAMLAAAGSREHAELY
jgi:hypothetical protein